MLTRCLNQELPEAGCDEAGRGCLAGPVVAAAVILPAGFHHPLLNDSKQVGEKGREVLREVIIKEAVCWGVGVVEAGEIDKYNILNASFMAMHRALEKLDPPPLHLLIDGNRFTAWKEVPYKTIVKGDSLYANIAAASILAKTYRDELMGKLHHLYPQYHWDNNKGYPTRQHRRAIYEYGISPHHRKSFNLMDTQAKLDF